MSASHDSADRAPLLPQSDASSLSKSSSTSLDPERNARDEQPTTISTLRGTVVVASIGLLIFLQATNISILTTTQSAIAADLDAFENATWFTSSYLIAMASLAPLSGRLSQLFSPRLCIFYSTMIVCIGSLICSLSSSFEVFIVGRVVTGAGAAGILIVATIIVLQLATHKQRGLWIGSINSGMTVGVSLGAVIAGAVQPKFGWKILFGAQTPLGLLAGFGLLWGIPAGYLAAKEEYADLSLREKLRRVDYFGAVSLTTTLVLFLLGLSGPRIMVTPIVLSALLLPVFILNEIKMASDPIIPVSLLKSRGMLLTCLATLGHMMARWSILFYAPVYALAIRDWPPAVAGSILIPTNAGFATGGLLAGVVHIRRSGSFYIHCLVVMALTPFTFLVLALVSNAHTPAPAFVATVFVNGMLTGAALNYTLVHALHLTLPSVHPIALSLIATFRGFAGSFGSAVGGGIFTRILYNSLKEGFAKAGLTDEKDLIRRLLGSPALVRNLQGKEKEVAVDAYSIGIRSLFFAAMGLQVVVVALQAGTGWKEPAEAKVEGISEEDEEAAEDEGLLAGS